MGRRIFTVSVPAGARGPTRSQKSITLAGQPLPVTLPLPLNRTRSSPARPPPVADRRPAASSRRTARARRPACTCRPASPSARTAPPSPVTAKNGWSNTATCALIHWWTSHRTSNGQLRLWRTSRPSLAGGHEREVERRLFAGLSAWTLCRSGRSTAP